MSTKTTRGFTLIELLVVIAIIGLLSSVVLASVNTARGEANDAKRVTDLRDVQTALELYAGDHNGSYPVGGAGASRWAGQCANAAGLAQNAVITGLVPTYIPSLPADPEMNTTANTCCYLYISDGASNYDFMDYNCPTANVLNPNLRSLLDTLFNGTPGNNPASWSVNTGYAGW